MTTPNDRWSAMIPNPHPPSNCGPLLLALPVGSMCPTCGTTIVINDARADDDSAPRPDGGAS